ncbi:MAG: hypothetical protein HUU50_15075 [Candidatus Brocadiae bacterium]|nr:hypothetical protein [Candidatus Brocadiia bacterium]
MKNTHPESYDFLQEQILQECQAMAKHVFSLGLKVQPGAIQTIENFALYQEKKKENLPKPDIQDLVQAHAHLSQIVAPATPRAILLLDKDYTRGMSKLLGPVPLVRSMTMLCVFFLFLFSGISLCPQIFAQVIQGYIFSSLNTIQLGEYLLVLSSAGIGASFSTLFKANEYILNSTFDKRHESSYWIRFFLGLFSGIILVQFVPIEGDWKIHAKPTLAMLGGFSSLAVYKILARLVEIMETIIPGHKKSAEEQVLKSRLMEQAAFIKLGEAEEESKKRAKEESFKMRIEMQLYQEKMKIVSHLLEVQKSIQQGEKPDQTQNRISQIIASVLSGEKAQEKNVEVQTESVFVGEEESKNYPFLKFEEEKPASSKISGDIENTKQLPPVNIRSMKQEDGLLPLKSHEKQ